MLIGLSASGPHQAEAIRRALSVTVDGEQLFTEAEVTWNLLEPSVGPAAAEAAAAGWAILVKEAVANGRLTAAGGPPAFAAGAGGGARRHRGRDRAGRRARPAVGNGGAVRRRQPGATGAQNLAALTVGPLPPLGLAEAPAAYWQERAARPWR